MSRRHFLKQCATIPLLAGTLQESARACGFGGETIFVPFDLNAYKIEPDIKKMLNHEYGKRGWEMDSSLDIKIVAPKIAEQKEYVPFRLYLNQLPDSIERCLSVDIYSASEIPAVPTQSLKRIYKVPICRRIIRVKPANLMPIAIAMTFRALGYQTSIYIAFTFKMVNGKQKIKVFHYKEKIRFSSCNSYYYVIPNVRKRFYPYKLLDYLSW